MPKIKYFQNIADIRNELEEAHKSYNHPTLSKTADITYGLTDNERLGLPDDIMAMKYLIGCNHGYSGETYSISRPGYEVFERVFTRILNMSHYNLNTKMVQRMTGSTGNGVRKLYKDKIATCEYYLNMLKNPEYLSKLPRVIHP